MQASPSLAGSSTHSPVAGSQAFLRQYPSSPWGSGQTTTVTGSILHWKGIFEVSQTRVPLQGSPSSSALQSSLVLQSQVTGVPAQVPWMHLSPTVQGSLSSQGARLCVCAHPLIGSHESSVQTS